MNLVNDYRAFVSRPVLDDGEEALAFGLDPEGTAMLADGFMKALGVAGRERQSVEGKIELIRTALLEAFFFGVWVGRKGSGA